MKSILFIGATVAALASNVALADSAASTAEFAKTKNCLACHSVATKIVGPAYKDVAAKYAGQKDAEDKLVKKVLKGSTGTWGTIPMPANPQVNEAEAHRLVKWILTLK